MACSFTLLCGIQFGEHTLSIHSAVVGHMDGFQFGVAVNSAAVNILICTCLFFGELTAIFV